MENEFTLKECINQMVVAYRTLEQAKDDCVMVCQGSWDTLVEHDETIEEKGIEFSGIDKIAKKIAERKLKKVEADYKKMGKILKEVLGNIDED